MNSIDFMRRCLVLAKKGKAYVSPNPMVGCVIVESDKIIGEGYHQRFGDSHAEVNAIKSVYDAYGEKADELLKNAEVYVNLEPCAHFGKTPPCTDLLISKSVKKVIIANTDPFTEVNGRGILRLNSAGIQTETGVLESEGKVLNKRFFTRIEKQRPYVILKWAQTADGYFAPELPSQKWISGSESKEISHLWRHEEDAILVGKSTVIIDNPQLTSRIPNGKNPLRVVIDKNLDIPKNFNIYDNIAYTLVLNEKKTGIVGNVKFIEMEDMQYYLPQKVCYQLYLMDIQSLIVEGGVNILQQFIDSNIWDEIRIFESNQNWGSGKSAPKVNLEKLIIDQSVKVGQDNLKIYLNN